MILESSPLSIPIILVELLLSSELDHHNNLKTGPSGPVFSHFHNVMANSTMLLLLKSHCDTAPQFKTTVVPSYRITSKRRGLAVTDIPSQFHVTASSRQGSHEHELYIVRQTQFNFQSLCLL